MADEWTDPIVKRREDLQLGCRRLEHRWKFVSDWPPRLQSRQDYLPCFRCNAPTTLYYTDDRIWTAMNGSWRDAVLCFACLRWLVDHSHEPLRVHPATAKREWDEMLRIPQTRWNRIMAVVELARAGDPLAIDLAAKDGDLVRIGKALHLISTRSTSRAPRR
jgi:hypothetical protein